MGQIPHRYTILAINKKISCEVKLVIGRIFEFFYGELELAWFKLSPYKRDVTEAGKISRSIDENRKIWLKDGYRKKSTKISKKLPLVAIFKFQIN